MKAFDIKISVINPNYDPQYEKEYGFLERQYENPKFDSEITWRFKDSTEYRYREDTTFGLEYSVNDLKCTCTLKNVCILELLRDAEVVTRFIVSQSLLSGTRKINKKNYNKGYFYFCLKPNIEYITLTESIYIAESEIPEELK